MNLKIKHIYNYSAMDLWGGKEEVQKLKRERYNGPESLDGNFAVPFSFLSPIKVISIPQSIDAHVTN